MEKRILLLNEASMFNSGLGKYGKNLLFKLKERGYKVAELGFGAGVNPPNDQDIPWRTYYNEVLDSDPRKQVYNQDPDNRFGKWRFEKTLLDFKPHYVLSILDPWNTMFIPKSPMRKYFNYIFMPTFDSFPVKEEWMSSIADADRVLTYSDWAAKKCPIPVFGTPKYGVNGLEFFPVQNKKMHKSRFGINSNKTIIGSIMKNQPRKKIADLFRMYKMILDKNPNTMLYLHAEWPGKNPWNIPKLLLEYEIQNHVLLTYYCISCEKFYPSVYQGDCAPCQHCYRNAAYIKSSAYSISDTNFNDIYNLFDLYVQYSNSEGAGMPVAEAAYCGLPTFVVDYTAMEDYKNTISSIPLPILDDSWDMQIDAYRALVDNKKSAEIILDYINKGSDELQSLGNKSRAQALEIYNWDKVADEWEKAIESIPLNDKWNNKIDYITTKLSENSSPTDIAFFIKRIMKVNDPVSLLGIHESVINQEVVNKYMVKNDPQRVVKDLNNWIDYYNKCENIRTGLETQIEEDFIEYAHVKEKVHEDNNIS